MIHSCSSPQLALMKMPKCILRCHTKIFGEFHRHVLINFFEQGNCCPHCLATWNNSLLQLPVSRMYRMSKALVITKENQKHMQAFSEDPLIAPLVVADYQRPMIPPEMFIAGFVQMQRSVEASNAAGVQGTCSICSTPNDLCCRP